MTALAQIKPIKKAAGFKAKKKHINDNLWNRWIAHSARTYSDIASIIPSVELPHISLGHRQLLELTLAVKDYVQEISNSAIDQRIVANAQEKIRRLGYFAYHLFGFENHLLKTLDVPTYHDHIHAHSQVIDFINQHLSKFLRGEVSLTTEVFVGLLDSVLEHINLVDVPTYRLVNLKSFLSQKLSWTQLQAAIKLTGLVTVDQHIQTVTEALLRCINSSEAELEITKKVFEEALQAYTSYEENLLKELNNTSSFDTQKEEHEEMLELAEFAANINDYRTFMQTWLYHVNLVDFKTHDFDNWARILFEEAEDIEEFDFLLKKSADPIVASYHERIISYILNSDVYSQDSVQSSIVFCNELRQLVHHLMGVEEQKITQLKCHHFQKISHTYEHLRIMSYIDLLVSMTQLGDYRINQEHKYDLLKMLIGHFNFEDILLYGQSL